MYIRLLDTHLAYPMLGASTNVMVSNPVITGYRPQCKSLATRNLRSKRLYKLPLSLGVPS